MMKDTKIISRQNNIHLVSYHEYVEENLWGILGSEKEIKTTIVSHYMSGGTLEGEQLQIIHDEK